jgi:hypothetical protein
VYEFLADPRSKYGRSTDYRFHRSHTTSYKEIGVYDHRPLLSTGAVDLPPTDDFIGSEFFNRGLAWARSPLPGALAYNADWGPLYFHQTNPTVELLGGCFFLLKVVNYARDQAAAHYPASQDLAERFKRILYVLPICTGHRYLGPMKGNREWYEKTHTKCIVDAAGNMVGHQRTQSGEEAMKPCSNTQRLTSKYAARPGLRAFTAVD